MANKVDTEGLLNGVDKEIGRIGYVAITRTRNLFWLDVKTSALLDLQPRLLDLGF